MYSAKLPAFNRTVFALKLIVICYRAQEVKKAEDFLVGSR